MFCRTPSNASKSIRGRLSAGGALLLTDIDAVRGNYILLLILALSGLTACGTLENERVTAAGGPDYGVLVMAHGGSPEWNAAVEEAVQPLAAQYPMALAFGMADAGSMEAAVRELEAAGVRHVGVVRLFVSGESWYERTGQILGLQAGAPSPAVGRENAEHSDMAMPMGFWEIDTELFFHMHEDGLADAGEMDAVLLTRIAGLSRDPANEVVVVLAHGPGDDAENARWIARIGERTELARRELALRDVAVFTLREDWADKREKAEARIRDYVGRHDAAGHRVIVVPYRVQGFGPYHDVLAGLDYAADETGLMPHENVSEWLLGRANRLHQEAIRHHRQLLSRSD